MASQHYYSSSHDRSEYGAHQAAPLSTSKEPYGTPYGGNYVPQGPAPRKGQRLNPMTWSKRVKLIVGTLIAVILIVVIIVGAVVGTQNSKYPDYSSLTYNHADTFEPATFFNNFQYWFDPDPAQGFVHYDSQEWATNPTYNTTYVTPDAAYVQVDRKEPNAITGRHSARVQSTKQYNDGLFLFDVRHSPYGCAVWPAIWLADAYNWPTNGEIDIIEAVNQATTGVQSTLHTTQGCTMNVKRKHTGAVAGNNCWNGTDNNAGCGVAGDPSTFGQAFNQAGGGVYACELRSEGIRIWFFPRASLPGDVSAAIGTGASDNSHPDPSKWPEPLADFPNTKCNIGDHFRNQSIIVNIDLCGQWAGRVYNTENNCPGDCKQFVAQNPTAFNDAFWQLGRFKVYQADR